jgi:hypothetical protein
MAAARRKKAEWREYRIELNGKRREDGSLFVTSSNLRAFSAVLPGGRWNGVVAILEKFLKINFGPVKDIRLIRDAAELSPHTNDDALTMPPAYVVAEITSHRVSAR